MRARKATCPNLLVPGLPTNTTLYASHFGWHSCAQRSMWPASPAGCRASRGPAGGFELRQAQPGRAIAAGRGNAQQGASRPSLPERALTGTTTLATAATSLCRLAYPWAPGTAHAPCPGRRRPPRGMGHIDVEPLVAVQLIPFTPQGLPGPRGRQPPGTRQPLAGRRIPRERTLLATCAGCFPGRRR